MVEVMKLVSGLIVGAEGVNAHCWWPALSTFRCTITHAWAITTGGESLRSAWHERGVLGHAGT